jgi:CBS domain-containing protein
MRISQVLASKGSQVVTTGPRTSITDAVRLLMEHGIGAVVVVDDDGPVGIFTERDLLRYMASANPDIETTPVADLMTPKLVTAAPTDGVGDAMEIMRVQRIRHLPIMEDGAMVGIVSIRDVLEALRRATEEENEHLKTYIFAVR